MSSDALVKDSAPTTPRGQARALVVEDSPAMRQEIAAALGEFGYAVTTAESGIEAIRLAEQQPDVMLVDLVLPDLSGFNVCRTIRSRPHTSQIPVVILTSDSRPKTVVQAFRNGASDFVEKPFVPEVLAQRINRIVRERVNEVEMARRFEDLNAAHSALAATRADMMLQQRLSALGMMTSGLAHEMNSPLGALLASLQYVIEGRADTEEDVKDALRDALKAGERVAELVRRMSNIAGSDGQKRDLVDLKRRVELACEAFSSSPIEIVGQEVEVPAVEAELREAIVALIDNAVRAASQSPVPKVRVTVDVSGDFARLTVDDNGNGIDAADVPYVLTPFFTRNRGSRAMGLGLSMVDAAARRHGGRIVIEGKGPLGGARATLWLPREDRAISGEFPAVSESHLVLSELMERGPKASP